LVFAAAGCGTQGLVLEQPDQLQDLKPTALSTTKLPVTISWHARRLAAGERFLVFIDQQPIAPGQSLRSIVADTCKHTPGCPNKAYLEQNFIFATRGDHVQVQVLPLQGPFPVNDLYNLHRATIVIFRDGKRVGEEFWSTSFFAATI
jgi:hypothetical protein